MKRPAAVAVGIAAIAIAVVIWRCRVDSPKEPTASGSGSGSGSMTGPYAGSENRRVDPRKLARGSISGTIRDDRGASIARARACADWESPELSSQLTRDPICVAADERGMYTIPNLLAARYWVQGMAPTYAPAKFLAGGKPRDSAFTLAAGEHRTGVDIVLRGGAVEVTGTVYDVSGGPIARARVWGRSVGTSDHVVETDDAGRFSLWLLPGDARVAAFADGYTKGQEEVAAPGTVDLKLIPESSISGTVVDASTGEPRPGVRVEARSTDLGRGTDDDALTDEAGRFRIDRLVPSRYALEARSANGYGHSEGSLLVGLGQHVDDAVIELHPAYRIEAQILVAETKQPCPGAELSIMRDDRYHQSSGTDRLVLDGLVPGSYRISIECEGHHGGGELRQPITIVDRDLTGLVWEVFEGGTLHGFVRTQSGSPVPDAEVTASRSSPRSRGHARTDDNGEFTITGLRAGEHAIHVTSTAGVGPKDLRVDITAGTTAETAIVVESGATLTGIVVDPRGKPMARLFVHATLGKFVEGRMAVHDVITRDDGTFHIAGLPAGDYFVSVRRGEALLRKAGAREDEKPSHRVTVEAGRTSSLRLVVEDTNGTIRGSVVDGDGKPISDAWVIGARESDVYGSTGNAAPTTYWTLDASPNLTSVDGTFELRDLAAGKYTVRAFRRGGGDAIAEHVPVGSTTRLQIKPTASIEGTIRLANGTPPDDFSVIVFARALGLFRRESLFRTGGRYIIRDLPAATFEVRVSASKGRGSFEVTLTSGEKKTGADVVLADLVTVTGTLVERGSRAPIGGMHLFTTNVGGVAALDELVLTDARGRFTIEGVSVGRITIKGTSDAVGAITVVRTIPASPTGTFDLGEVAVVKPRIKPGERAGRFGVRFDYGEAEDRVDVAWIDPNGPAAKTELRVGDRVISVDGTDVTGDNAGHFDALTSAPPNTTISLGLGRGVTVKIVLAGP